MKVVRCCVIRKHRNRFLLVCVLEMVEGRAFQLECTGHRAQISRMRKSQKSMSITSKHERRKEKHNKNKSTNKTNSTIMVMLQTDSLI